jgi:SRSO17 transposase
VLNQRRLALLCQSPQTSPDQLGVLIIDDTGDRKWGNKTAHVGRQYLGSLGKIDNGVVSVSSLWANERMYYPILVCQGKERPGISHQAPDSPWVGKRGP